MVVGCYVLHLYCESQDHGPRDGHIEFTGASRTDALRVARAAGWHISHRTSTALCPKHASGSDERHSRARPSGSGQEAPGASA